MILGELEAQLFDLLIEADGKPLTAKYLASLFYGENWIGGEQLIRVRITHIRNKLGKGAIVNRVRHGYTAGLVG